MLKLFFWWKDKLFFHNFFLLKIVFNVYKKWSIKPEQKINCWGGSVPPKPSSSMPSGCAPRRQPILNWIPLIESPFELNPLTQLVIGYHWLPFLNQVHKELKKQSSKSPIHQEFWVQNQPKIGENWCRIRFRTLRIYWDTIFYAHISQFS